MWKAVKNDEDVALLTLFLSYLKDMADKKRESVVHSDGRLVETKRSAMRRIFFLWLLHIAGVISLTILPIRIWEVPPSYSVAQTRLYGATMAKDGEFPFMIFIYLQSDILSQCSASLLLSDWVLTAAHCFEGFPERKVFLIGGKTNLTDYLSARQELDWEDDVDEAKLEVQERRARAVYIHPEYKHTADGLFHDVALIRTEKPFTITNNIKPITLNLDKIYYPKTCTIVGWGKTPESVYFQLHAVREKEIRTTSIGCAHRDKSYTLICLKNDRLSGICQGDSGSPLVCGGEVFGVASFLITSTGDCGDSLEEYYTELSNDRPWIRSLLNAGSRPIEIDFTRAFMFAFTALWISSNTLYRGNMMG